MWGYAIGDALNHAAEDGEMTNWGVFWTRVEADGATGSIQTLDCSSIVIVTYIFTSFKVTPVACVSLIRSFQITISSSLVNNISHKQRMDQRFTPWHRTILIHYLVGRSFGQFLPGTRTRFEKEENQRRRTAIPTRNSTNNKMSSQCWEKNVWTRNEVEKEREWTEKKERRKKTSVGVSQGLWERKYMTGTTGKGVNGRETEGGQQRGEMWGRGFS